MTSKVQDEKINKWRLRSAYLITMISLSLVLFVFGLLLLMGLHARKLATHVQENIGFTLYFYKAAKEAEILRLKKTLDTMPWIRSCLYISPEEAEKILKEEIGDDFSGFLGYNPLQASLQVKIKAPWTHPDSIKKLEALWKSNPQIAHIDYQQNLISQVFKNLQTIGLVLGIFIVLMLIVSVGLMSNTIRLAVYSKRFIIRSMLLVGATRSFIRKPFIMQGFLQGMLSALIAIILLAGVLYFTAQQVPDLKLIADLQILQIAALSLFIIGGSISALANWLAVTRYLNMKIDQLYT